MMLMLIMVDGRKWDDLWHSYSGTVKHLMWGIGEHMQQQRAARDRE